MTTAAVAVPPEIRSKLALVLDVDDVVAALRLARDLRPWFGVAKVGLELYSASGPDVVGGLSDLGYDVFCDLKFHDIPTTVGRAARVIGALGATYLNFHAQGGVPMLTAGVEGFLTGASDAGLPAPIPLASPEEAIASGADVLVIGRAVTHAESPEAAAAALVASLTR